MVFILRAICKFVANAIERRRPSESAFTTPRSRLFASLGRDRSPVQTAHKSASESDPMGHTCGAIKLLSRSSASLGLEQQIASRKTERHT
jgi:hypothetical protein